MLTSDEKGAIAETGIVHAAVKLGIGVLKPIMDAQRYDLVFDLGSRLVRVQCKWAVRRGGVVSVRCVSCRRSADGLLYRAYAAGEIDAIAAYCLETDRCYYLPAGLVTGRREISLRLQPTKNGQKRGIRWADDFDFTRLDWNSISGP